MTLTLTAGMFAIGKVVITPEAIAKLSRDDVIEGLARHLTGDWGELDEFEWKVNDDAMEDGNRLFSRYRTRSGTWFWIMTEPDRSLTTVLLPSNATQ
jgi:hypothetical protein